MRPFQRISYSYLIPVQFVTMVVVHCTINHEDAVRLRFGRFPMGRPSEIDCRACISRSDSVSLHTTPVFPESCAEPMRLSRFFLPILRETPKEAEIVSHRLM